jgi:hypothetical protein
MGEEPNMSDAVPPEEAVQQPSSDPNLRWYVVRVQSGREESVKDGLLRRVNAAGSDRRSRT